MRLLRAITASSRVSSQITADGRWMAIQHSGYLALIMSGSVKGSNLVSPGLSKVCAIHLGHFNLPA
jgi:hypothetical protein